MNLSPWAEELAGLTAPYRESRAKALTSEGRRRRREASEHAEASRVAAEFRAKLRGPFPSLDQAIPSVGSAGLWHFQRARGQRERFERVSDCQQATAVEIKCESCGRSSVRGARCRTALVCTSCRGKISHEKRARLATNRRAAWNLVATRGLTRTKRAGGRWSEKLITLTIPHFPELDVAARIRFVRLAWGHFAGHWNLFWKLHPDAQHQDRQGHSLVRWFRNLEWTPGDEDERFENVSDDQGHPHVHMWFLGPWLPGARASDDPRSNVVRNMWSDALRLAARKFSGLRDRVRLAYPILCSRPWEYREVLGLPRVLVDVRACRPGPESLREVIKYLFKDTVKGGHKLRPSTWAKVFEGFDGSRTTQGSRGLMSLALREHALNAFVVEDGGALREVAVSDWRKARLILPNGREVRLGASVCVCGEAGCWRVKRRPMTAPERAALVARRPLRKAGTSIGQDPTAKIYERVAIR